MNTTSPRRRPPNCVLAGPIAALMALSMSNVLTRTAAAALTWDADGSTAGQIDGGGGWKNANLWWTGSANQTWVTDDDAIFGVGGTGGAVTLASPTTVNTLTFNSFSGTYTLGSAGQAITLNAGLTMNASSGAVTITSPVILGGSQSWTNNDDSTLTVSGAVTGAGETLTLNGTGAGLTTLTGGLSFTGGGGLVVGQSGTLGTTVSGGTINLGGSGGITIDNGASAFTLGAATISTDQTWTNNSATAMTANGILALGTSRLTLAGGDFSLGGANTGSVGIDLNGGSKLIAKVAGAFGTSATTLTFNGGNLELRAVATTFTGRLNMTAAGTTVTINPASAGAGVTHTISGAATLGGSQTMVISAGSLTNIDTNYGLTLSGAKTLTDNSTYTINGHGSGNGTLTFSGGAIDLQSGTRTLTFNVGTGTGVRSASISGSLVAGNGILDLAGDAPVTIGALTTSANAIQVSGTGTYTFSGASTFTGGVSLNNAGATVIATVAGGLGSTSGKVKFNVDGTTLTLRSAAISYTSGLDTTSSNGTIKVEPATQSAGVVHTMTLANTFGSTTLNLIPGSLANNNTNYGLTLSGTSTISGDAVFDVANNGTGIGTLTLAALSQSGGPFTLTKQGAGTMTLGTAANVLFTGSAINVTNGVLISNVSGALSSVPTTTNNTTVTINGTGELRGTVAGSFKSSGTGTPSQAINLSGGTVRLFRSSAADFGGNLTYDSGSLILDRTTNGTTLTQTMASLNMGTATLTPTQLSYSAAPTLAFGSTTINGDPTLDATNVIFTLGALSIGGNTLTTQGNNAVTAGATTLSGDPTFDNSNGLTLGALGDGGGARTITKRGPATLTLNTTASSLVGGTTVNINAGAINQGVANALGVNSPSLSIRPTTGTGSYNLTAAVGQTLGAITLGGDPGTTAVIATGTGTLTLAGDVTYDAGGDPNGATISGQLNVGSTQKNFAIGDSGAALIDLTVSAVLPVAAGGSVLKTGSGTLLLSGASTAYAGGFSLNDGLTVAMVAGALGKNTSVVTFGGGSLELRNDTNTTFTALLNAGSSNGTITVNRGTSVATPTTHTMGTLAIGNGSTLAVLAGGNIPSGTTFGLTLGATTLFGDAVFDVANNGSGLGTLSLGALTQSGGPYTVTKQGAGTLTLGTVANVSFTGSAINVNDGVLISNLAGALSSVPATANTTTVTVNNGSELRGTVAGSFKSSGTGAPSEAINLADGTLRLFNAATTDFGGNLTYANGSVVLDRTASGGANTNTLGTLSIGDASLSPITVNYTTAPTLVFGATTLTGNPTFDTTNANITLGALGDNATPRAITKNGSGSLTLNAAATLLTAGTTITINGGLLVASVTGALSQTATTGDTTTVTVNSPGELRGTAAGSFKSTGTGTPSEAISLTGGTVRLFRNSATDFGGNLTYESGSLILDRTASGAAFTDTMGSLNIGSATLTPTQVNFTAAPTLTFNSTTITGDATLDSTNVIFTLGTLSVGGNTLTTQGGRAFTAGATTLSGDPVFNIPDSLTLGALDDGGGARTITKLGLGALTLSTTASGLVSGTSVNINAGTINQGAAHALGVNNPNLSIRPTTGTGLYNFTAAVGQTLGPITLGGDAGTTANITTGSGTLTLAGDVTYDAGGNPNGSTISGLLNVGNTQKNFAIGDSGAVVDLTVSAVLTGAAGGSIFKSGGGTLLLSGASTGYTGGFVLNEGATVATVAGALGASTSIVSFGGGGLELRNDTNTTFTAGLNAVASSGTLTVNRANAAGAVTTHTMGTLAIGNGNTLSVVAGGNINPGTAYGLTVGATTISGDAFLDVASNGAGLGTLIVGALAQSGGPYTVTKQGAGTLTLGTAANVSFTGSAINVNDGMLIANLAGALSSVPTTANTTTVTVNNPGELRGTVTGSFRSSGTGTPSQAINLAGGTVRLASSTAATFGGNLTYSEGSLIVDRTASGAALTQTMNSLNIGSATLTPTTASYTAAPTLAFGSATITGDPTLDGSNVIFSLGALSIGSNTLTTQGTHNVTAGPTTLSGDPAFNNVNSLTLGALGDGGTARTITKFGSGTLTLGAAATLLSPGTAINLNEGVLIANVTGALSQTATTANTTTVTVNNGGELRGTAAGAFKSTGAGTPSEAINLADGTVRLLRSLSTDFGGNLTYASGSLILDRGSSGGSHTQTMNSLSIGTTTLTPAQVNYTAAPTLAFTSTTITGDATLDATAARFSLGSLGIGANTLTVQGGRFFTAGATTLTGAAVLSLAPASPLTVGTITGAGHSLTIQGAGDFGQTDVFDGVGSVFVLDSGYTGTATLSGANSYTGGTNINGGVLFLDHSSALGATGTISFGGGTLQFGIANANDYSNRFSTADGQVFHLDTNGELVTLGTTLTNTTQALVKSGPGILALTGTNTFSSVSISEGSLIGGVLSFDGAGTPLTGTGDSTVTSTVVFTANGGTITSAAGTLNLDGIVNSGGMNINFDGAGDIAVFNAFANGTTLSKNGGGTLFLYSTNNYTEGTTVNGGTLRAFQATSLGAVASPLQVNNAGTLVSFFTGETNTIGSLSGSGSSTLDIGDQTLSISQTSDGTYQGSISGDGGLTKIGAGILQLSGAASYTGETVIGAGTLTLNGANGSINTSSAIVLMGGTLRMQNAGATEALLNRMGDAAGTTSYGGGIRFNNANDPGVTYAETMGALTLAGGQLNVVLDQNMTNGGNNQTLTFAGLSQAGNAAVTFSGPGVLPNATANVFKVTGAGPTTAGQILAPWATVGVSSADQRDYAVHDGATSILAANIAASAETTWTVATHSYTMGSTQTLTGTRNIAALRYTGVGDDLNLGQHDLETFGILNGATNYLQINSGGGVVTTASGGGQLYVTAGSQRVIINAPVADNDGPVTVVKSGYHELTLAGANTHSGGLVINAGTVNLNSMAALGTGTLVLAGGSLDQQFTHVLNNPTNNEVTINADFTFNGSNNLNLGTGAVSLGTTPGTTRTITVGDNARYLLIGGVIGDGTTANGLTKAGDNSALILTGSNTYTGATTVTNGALIARNSSALGVGGGNNVLVVGNGNGNVNNATLSYVAATDTALVINGTLSLAGTGSPGNTLTLGGSIGATTTSAQIDVTGLASATGNVKVNIHGVNGGTPAAGTNDYTLLHSADGSSTLNGATYAPGLVLNNSNFTTGAFSVTETDVRIAVTRATPLATAYWVSGLGGEYNVERNADSVWGASNGSSSSNWAVTSGGAAQALVPGPGTDVIFDANGGNHGTTVLGADMSIRGLTLGTATNPIVNEGLRLHADGYSLTLGAGGINATSFDEQGVELYADVVLNAAQTWTNNASGQLFTFGTVSNNGNLLTVDAQQAVGIYGAINGSGGLAKAGTGTLILAGANTHTGITSVGAGTLELNKVNALQSSTLDTGSSGAQEVTFTVGGNNTYSLGGLSGADSLNAGANSLSIGANDLNTTSTGDITATAVTKVGAGILDLNGANQTYDTLTVSSGTANVNGVLGTIPANGTASVVVADNARLKFGSVSQTLGSLSIGAGATVTFTSAVASGAFTGGASGGKAPAFAGSAAVPEPGTLGLLLVGALGLLNRRRRV